MQEKTIINYIKQHLNQYILTVMSIVLISSMLYYAIPINFSFLNLNDKLDSIKLEIDDYYTVLNGELSKEEIYIRIFDEHKKKELISVMKKMKLYRWSKKYYNPLNFLDNERIMYISNGRELRIEIYMNVYSDKYSIITINGRRYKISKKDEIKLLRIFNKDLPLER